MHLISSESYWCSGFSSWDVSACLWRMIWLFLCGSCVRCCAEPQSIETLHAAGFPAWFSAERSRSPQVQKNSCQELKCFKSATGNASDGERKLFSVCLCIYDVALKGTVQTKPKKSLLKLLHTIYSMLSVSD